MTILDQTWQSMGGHYARPTTAMSDAGVYWAHVRILELPGVHIAQYRDGVTGEWISSGAVCLELPGSRIDGTGEARRLMRSAIRERLAVT